MDENNPVNQESLEKQKIEQLKKEMKNIEDIPAQETTPQPSQPVQQPEASDPPPPVVPEAASLQGLKKSKGILWISLALLLLAIVGVGAYYLGSHNVFIPVSSPTPVQTPTTTPDPTADWKTYINEEADFSFKYPSEVGIVSMPGENSGMKFELYVDATLVDEIKDPPFNVSRATAINDIESLKNGEYGERVVFSMENSGKVIVVGGVNAKTYLRDFVVLEICDVGFARTLIVYHNDYQIRLTLRISDSSTNEIKIEASEYFTVNSENCGEDRIWDLENNAPNVFYQKLTTNTLSSEIVNDWYKTFDQILSTFKFIEATP